MQPPVPTPNRLLHPAHPRPFLPLFPLCLFRLFYFAFLPFNLIPPHLYFPLSPFIPPLYFSCFPLIFFPLYFSISPFSFPFCFPFPRSTFFFSIFSLTPLFSFLSFFSFPSFYFISSFPLFSPSPLCSRYSRTGKGRRRHGHSGPPRPKGKFGGLEPSGVTRSPTLAPPGSSLVEPARPEPPRYPPLRPRCRGCRTPVRWGLSSADAAAAKR